MRRPGSTTTWQTQHLEHPDPLKLLEERLSAYRAPRIEGVKVNGELFDEQIRLPKAPPLLAPLLHLVALQLFAYFTAVALQRNVDRPRSLAKSVTVG